MFHTPETAVTVILSVLRQTEYQVIPREVKCHLHTVRDGDPVTQLSAHHVSHEAAVTVFILLQPGGSGIILKGAISTAKTDEGGRPISLIA